MITNIISLVRFAYRKINQLRNTKQNTKQYFELWLGHIFKNKGENLSEIQKEIAFNLAEYIVTNGAVNEQEFKQDSNNVTAYMEIKNVFGKEKIQELMQSLSKFMLAA